MLSFWEKESFISYDVIVIGSGITGLSTAISLIERDASLSVLVLEKGWIPTGASTKNAGFACIGSLTEILDDLKHLRADEVLDLVSLRRDGLAVLRGRLGDAPIDYFEKGSYEILFEKEVSCLNELDKVNELLFPIFNKTVFQETANNFGFSNQVKKVVSSSVEGQLHTGKMMRQLMLYAQQLGIQIKSNCEVGSIEEEENGVIVEVANTRLKAKQVAVCTNAFSKKLLPDLELKPGRGQVLITNPIENLPFEGIYHFDKGYYYFRTVGNRVLFGGGRNVDFEAETTTTLALNEDIQQDLTLKLNEIILPNTAHTIDISWAGIMAFGDNKLPTIRSLSERIHVGVRLGGMGVAIGSKVGEKLAKLVLESG